MENTIKGKIKRRKVLMQDLVFEEIKNLILDDTWQMGDKLPSENELAQMFDVNRLTIRLALQKLNTLGITETRDGEGTFVINFSMYGYMKQAASFYTNQSLIDDVHDFRRHIEIECARLAMQNATPKEIDDLIKKAYNYSEFIYLLLDEEEIPSPSSILKLVELDLDFHHTICKMSHNLLFQYSFELAKAPIQQYLKGIIVKRIKENQMKKQLNKELKLELHTLIAKAIAENDFETCKKAYTDMIDYTVIL